jgi:hypothetical protein
LFLALEIVILILNGISNNLLESSIDPDATQLI